MDLGMPLRVITSSQYSEEHLYDNYFVDKGCSD